MSSKLLVGRYELIEKIGEGGMAVVYKSRDRLLNRLVAIKILRPEFTKDAQFVDSFRRESQAAAGLQHPNIISVYDVGREGNIHFIVMELVDGKPLSDIIKEQAPMDYRRAIEITKQVASALSLAHKHNIIHRDIKPHNIMITQDGTAKLGDFGIAKAVSDSTMTETSKIIGSVHYFSPEQARGAYVDERSDLYSLGIVLYEMLTGQVPFDGDNPVQVALMHINDEITPPSQLVGGIPPALEKLVMKATDKFQSNRFRSADEMLEELNNVEFVSNVVGGSVFNPNGYGRRLSSDYNGGYQDNYADDRQDSRSAVRSSRASGSPSGKKKKNSRKKLIILLVVILAIAAALTAYLFASGTIGGGGQVTVPDLTDMSYTEAKSALEDVGLKIERGDKINSDTIEKGHVARQDPQANEKVDKDTVVTVNISDGIATGAVPDLVGKYYGDETDDYLKNHGGFVVGNVSYAKSDSYEKGQIISQDPEAGTSAEKGTEINIVVCSGKKTVKVTVPSLTGLSFEEASAKLHSNNLKTGQVIYEESTTYSKGTVMWQQYDAGTELKQGASVNVKVSKGPPADEPDPNEPGDNDDDDNNNSNNSNSSDNGSDTQE